MTLTEEKKLSKFLSLILRHKPETIDLHLDDSGWAVTSELIEKMNASGRAISTEDLEQVVRNSDKKRFAFSDDRSHIRANQGHSIPVELQLSPVQPPNTLFHGTATKNLDSIRSKGLLKQERHHVHLSQDHDTAKKVGTRYGKPVVLHINTEKMFNDGHHFFVSENGVWLTDHVPASYIKFE